MLDNTLSAPLWHYIRHRRGTRGEGKGAAASPTKLLGSRERVIYPATPVFCNSVKVTFSTKRLEKSPTSGCFVTDQLFRKTHIAESYILTLIVLIVCTSFCSPNPKAFPRLRSCQHCARCKFCITVYCIVLYEMRYCVRCPKSVGDWVLYGN